MNEAKVAARDESSKPDHYIIPKQEHRRRERLSPYPCA